MPAICRRNSAMMKRVIVSCCALLAASFVCAQTSSHSAKLMLSDGWHLQSAAKVESPESRFRVRALRRRDGIPYRYQALWSPP